MHNRLYHKTLFLAAFLMVAATQDARAQGCSDAGLCTVQSYKPAAPPAADAPANRISAGLSYGRADHNITATGFYLSYIRRVNDRLDFEAKLASLSQNGNGIAAWGLSDVYVNAGLRVGANGRVLLGAKIPLTDGNTSANQRSYPMDYQSSLGTLDLLAGFSWSVWNFQLLAALQQPLSQNSNTFVAENYPADSPLRAFQSTRNYKRSGDLLLRISYPVGLGSRLRITPALLPIYHLANDRYTLASGVEQSIEGSAGLTLNGNVFVDYALGGRHALQCSVGMPFLVRKARPDGLTRAFVAGIEYSFRF